MLRFTIFGMALAALEGSASAGIVGSLRGVILQRAPHPSLSRPRCLSPLGSADSSTVWRKSTTQDSGTNPPLCSPLPLLSPRDQAGGGPNTSTALSPPNAKLFDMA